MNGNKTLISNSVELKIKFTCLSNDLAKFSAGWLKTFEVLLGSNLIPRRVKGKKLIFYVFSGFGET